MSADMRLLYGDLRTGRIVGQIDAASAPWSAVGNDAGTIGATVTENVVRDLRLRWTAPTLRTFLAFVVDDRIQEAGPLWTRAWDDEKGELTLGATGLWALFDHRKVLPLLIAAGTPIASGADLGTLTFTGADYGDIARQLVAQATAEVGGSLPIVLPDARPGAQHTETFPGFQMLWVGDQLRQLTQREDDAPDIRFSARYRSDDRRYIEWVMETGTADSPELAQVGGDWIFDHRTRRSPVVRINTDEDGTAMAERAFALGQGMEEGQLIGEEHDTTLLDAGWPLTERNDLYSSVSELGTLQGHAFAQLLASARPVENWKVVVRASLAAEVLVGDYCQVIPRAQNAWLGEVGQTRTRVWKKSGDLGENVTLEMYPLEAIL